MLFFEYVLKQNVMCLAKVRNLLEAILTQFVTENLNEKLLFTMLRVSRVGPG